MQLTLRGGSWATPTVLANIAFSIVFLYVLSPSFGFSRLFGNAFALDFPLKRRIGGLLVE
jgi:hypothetical protein